MLNPFDISIHNQAEDEQIEHVWRHHPITLVGPLFRVVAFILIPVLLLLISGLAMFSSPWLFSIFIIILAICLTYAAYEWVSWWGDVFVVTNYRMVDVETTGFFHRSFAEASLDKIQDVSYDIKGVLASVFNFGDVVIQTAGQENIEMNVVRDPGLKTKRLLTASETFKEEHGIAEEGEEMSAEEMLRLLKKYGKDLADLPDMDDPKQKAKVQQTLRKLKDKNKKTAKDDHSA